MFGFDEVKLLGHIILKDGVRIDIERVEEIKNAPLYPKTRKLSNPSLVKEILSEYSYQT